MDISGVETASLAANVSQNDRVAISVLKKALDIQEQSALQLIESIPQPTANSGNNVNVKV